MYNLEKHPVLDKNVPVEVKIYEGHLTWQKNSDRCVICY